MRSTCCTSADTWKPDASPPSATSSANAIANRPLAPMLANADALCVPLPTARLSSEPVSVPSSVASRPNTSELLLRSEVYDTSRRLLEISATSGCDMRSLAPGFQVCVVPTWVPDAS